MTRQLIDACLIQHDAPMGDAAPRAIERHSGTRLDVSAHLVALPRRVYIESDECDVFGTLVMIIIRDRERPLNIRGSSELLTAPRLSSRREGGEGAGVVRYFPRVILTHPLHVLCEPGGYENVAELRTAPLGSAHGASGPGQTANRREPVVVGSGSRHFSSTIPAALQSHLHRVLGELPEVVKG